MPRHNRAQLCAMYSLQHRSGRTPLGRRRHKQKRKNLKEDFQRVFFLFRLKNSYANVTPKMWFGGNLTIRDKKRFIIYYVKVFHLHALTHKFGGLMRHFCGVRMTSMVPIMFVASREQFYFLYYDVRRPYARRTVEWGMARASESVWSC